MRKSSPHGNNVQMFATKLLLRRQCGLQQLRVSWLFGFRKKQSFLRRAGCLRTGCCNEARGIGCLLLRRDFIDDAKRRTVQIALRIENQPPIGRALGRVRKLVQHLIFPLAVRAGTQLVDHPAAIKA